MVEQVFKLYKGNEKMIEKVLLDENIHYLHMVLSQGDALPEHYTNSNLYMTVVRGTLSIKLDEQETHEYDSGTLLKIPYQTKMNVKNLHSDTLKLIVVKAPAPNM